MSEQNTGWRDISTVPYDEVVLFYTHDGNIVQDFMYDCGTKEMARVYTHWQPLLPPPGEDVESELGALQARYDKLEAAARSVLAHLVASVSVIERSEESGNHPSCAYGSDEMYRLAMKGFHRSIEAGRSALSPKENE